MLFAPTIGGRCRMRAAASVAVAAVSFAAELAPLPAARTVEIAESSEPGFTGGHVNPGGYGARAITSRAAWTRALLPSGARARSTTKMSAASCTTECDDDEAHGGASDAMRRAAARLGLKQANGAELWAKIVACGLIGSGPARLSLVGERFGEGLRCVEFTHVEGGWFLGG